MLNSRTRTALRLAPALIAIGLVAACSGSGGPPTVDTGVVQPWEMPEENFVEELVTQAKPDSGWLSAPWGLGMEVGPDSTTVPIIYVAGDALCYGPAGFTLDESGSKVTIGAYTKLVDLGEDHDPADCPTNPVAAWKYGHIVLAEPLGNRELVHAGLNDIYAEFVWPEMASPTAETPPDATGEASPEAPEDNQ